MIYTQAFVGMDRLKLIAFDADDLRIISAHLQDAAVPFSKLVYHPRHKRFAMIVSRFNWQQAMSEQPAQKAFERRLSTLSFERVLSVQQRGIDFTNKSSDVLNLLSLDFEPGDPPGGSLTLRFSGTAAIRLELECIEAKLSDLDAAWRARRKPDHQS